VPSFVATPRAVTAGSVDPETIDRDEIDCRIGVVSTIADVVEFLASDAASFMVGELVTVRGKPPTFPRPGSESGLAGRFGEPLALRRVHGEIRHGNG
jgi:hypothetical protein